jgi:hypothetical protein
VLPALRRYLKQEVTHDRHYQTYSTLYNAALALHFAYYNFCRIHKSIKMTPAMASGLTNKVWTIAGLLA